MTAYDDYGFEHWDAHDYGEYEPEPDEDDGDNWYAEEGEDFLRREVYEPLGRSMREAMRE